jgi:ATP-binding cassette subfamily B protein
MSTVQLFRGEARTFEQFDDINRKHRDANIDSILYYAVFYPAIEIIGALAAALIIWFGGRWTLQNTLTIGSLVAFLLYSSRFFRPISDMSEKFNVLQAAMASSERIFKLLDTPVAIQSGSVVRDAGSDPTPLSVEPRIPDRGSRIPARGPRDEFSGHIVFDHVWFAYNATSADAGSPDPGSRTPDPGSRTAETDPGSRTTDPGAALSAKSGEPNFVLRDISFEVKPGERIGVVGATGAGKSTLINLLLRFYDVTRGRILIDGTDIRDMDLTELRRLFGLVLQDVHLFSGTIAANIRLGNTVITDDGVRRAAEAVHANQFIERLPMGYDSAVAERGATLSVGQKQLLSFARALAFDPRILILDEATSSIDTETELLIRDALAVLMGGRTTIAIAHRLSTIQDMDKILVLHKGQLREAGRHQELLAQRGIYYKLYQLQYRDQERSEDATRPALSAPPL